MPTETRQRSCEERLPEHLNGRLDDLRAWVKAYQHAGEIAGDANSGPLTEDEDGIECTACGATWDSREEMGRDEIEGPCPLDDCESNAAHLTDEEARTATNRYDVAEARRELAQMTEDQLREQVTERIQELPLSIETRRIVDVCISTGGPEDRFELWLDADGEIDRVWYIFKDWFDGARRELERDDFETVKRIAEIAGWTEVYE